MDEIAFLLLILSAYILPVVLVLNSKRTQGHEKNAWLIGIIFFSWLGLVMYFAIVPKHGHKKKGLKKKA
ncbi:PLDc N-terminal domain-containing protein [Pseudoalteromonas shioyasakiensis]|uniref:PLDc N-terminal domain-containing protein n=1 Tax=Pseudoalteromonas shioyasakiensis TaxID=1190813 RepID=UPI002118EE89|nr:PLDc N-terminal domain-containing protein [Pseudoalteromonas shioyasakiensis]MCQ8879844.1 PLDc N-terminal domain-containing protein [Pseudoalteromonas shioyasakiensis]